jgi:hypothetical protein
MQKEKMFGRAKEDISYWADMAVFARNENTVTPESKKV